MSEIPTWFLEIAVVIFFGIGSFSFRYLLKRIESCESSALERRENDKDKLGVFMDRLNEKMTKQDILQARFDIWLEQNKKEHIILEITLKEIRDRLEEVSDCVSKLANGARDCK